MVDVDGLAMGTGTDVLQEYTFSSRNCYRVLEGM